MKWGHDAKGPTMTKRVDILEQLQCMVNTETPTPLKVVNSMLDLIPESVWLDDNAKILCPACKDGIFLREAVVRILRAKFKQLPDDKNAVYDFTMRQEGILHQILKERIFGIAVSYRGYRVTKRTLYTCNPAFADIDNIFFDESLGEYVTDKSGAQIEKQSFHFIKDTQAVADFFAKKGVENMKFDVIIGNPPYQTNDGGAGASASPIYNNFVEQAKLLNPQYLSMIIPSRWFSGGKGLDSFRNDMLTDKKLCKLVDFFDATDCFPGVDISGGVCYFLCDNNTNNSCEITSIRNGLTSKITRPLLEYGSDTFVRFNEAMSIVEKVKKFNEESFETLVSSRKPFGLATKLKLKPKATKDDIEIYAYPTNGFIPRSEIQVNEEWIDKYKVLMGKAYGERGSFPYWVLGKPKIAAPGTCCSETYLVVGPSNSHTETCNIAQYIQTRFFRFLVLLKKNTLNAPRGVYQFVPIQNFNEEWTDEKLYQKYNLTTDEIAFIESMVKPMDKDTVLSDNIDTDDE